MSEYNRLLKIRRECTVNLTFAEVPDTRKLSLFYWSSHEKETKNFFINNYRVFSVHSLDSF